MCVKERELEEDRYSSVSWNEIGAIVVGSRTDVCVPKSQSTSSQMKIRKNDLQ